jgi:hypothetical protein
MMELKGYVRNEDDILWFFWGEWEGEIVGLLCYVPEQNQLTLDEPEGGE